MTTIDFFASEAQYLDHIAPVWHALPERNRGQFVVPDGLIARAQARYIDPTPTTGGAAPYGLVASYRDMTLLAPRERGLVFMEHGAGQSYGAYTDPLVGRHPGYAGGTDRERVSLFLCPNEHSSQRNADAYPDAIVANVGSPWVETLTAREPVDHVLTIAVSFHSNVEVCPETMSAWPHWSETLLPMLFESGWRIVGHGHPRALFELTGWYQRTAKTYESEVIVVPEFEQVVDECDVLVCDNSSIMYAWAALHRNVVALNAPWYNRSLDHGLRFWDAVPGPQADDPVDLEWAMKNADDGLARDRAVAAAFGEIEGKAADRAAAAILDLIQ